MDRETSPLGIDLLPRPCRMISDDHVMGGGASTDREIADDDPRVVRALEEYLTACEAGRRPSRTQFLRKYSSIAPVLKDCLHSLESLNQAARHFEAPGLDDTSPFVSGGGDFCSPTRLGDYQLLREIGRGGMGVVYEARQLSLGRKVALKLLPFTAAIDPRQVQRFQVEVQAAAHLHHPHIVPIYAVGCESGVHYFAMQLVFGQSLAGIITEARERQDSPVDSWLPAEGSESEHRSAAASPPTTDSQRTHAFFRGVACLGIQAAEALEHAHSLGVVHRDIKPGNLLIDDRRHLWVADFGLARLQGDSGLTITGDVVGTLRYMSPEQALSLRGVVDHRTDLYSLGVTLYELLTLRPAFGGSDLQALVQQITQEDPVPPSRFNPRIPRDLETIVLKAMAKEPVNRYPTMQDLADDLTRFVNDQPIQARRPSSAEWAIRWSRRHRAIAMSGGIAVVLALICLSISTAVIWNSMIRTAQVSAARAQELNRAQGNLALAHRALDLYLNTAESWFPREPGDEHQDRDLLKTALTFYEQIASQNAADPEVASRTMEAYSRVGDIQVALDQKWGAEDAYKKAMRIMVERLAVAPDDDRTRTDLAVTLEKFGSLFRRDSFYGPAEWSADESIRLLSEVLAHEPTRPAARLSLAHALNQRATVLGETGRVSLALSDCRHALGLLRDLESGRLTAGVDPQVLDKELATVYSNLGKWLQLDGKLTDAEGAYRQALVLLDQLQAKGPRLPVIQESLALCHGMLGELLRATQRNLAAESRFKRAISGLERLAADYPRVPRYKKQIAQFYNVLSTLYWATDRREESAEARRQATTLQSQSSRG